MARKMSQKSIRIMLQLVDDDVDDDDASGVFQHPLLFFFSPKGRDVSDPNIMGWIREA